MTLRYVLALGHDLTCHFGMTTREALLQQVNDEHREYPQYAGYWNEWGLGEVTFDLRTKAGRAFRRGDVVLLSPERHTVQGMPFRTAYSARTQLNTSIPASHVRAL